MNHTAEGPAVMATTALAADDRYNDNTSEPPSGDAEFANVNGSARTTNGVSTLSPLSSIVSPSMRREVSFGPPSSVYTPNFSSPVDAAVTNMDGGLIQPFHRLTPPIIARILELVDPPTFSCLTVLNRRWRTLSDDSALYKHQLAQCRSLDGVDVSSEVNHKDADLSHLKKALAEKGRRNLWEGFTYKRTDLTIVAPSTSTLSAIPTGESFRFTFSPRGRLLVAISSSRIFLIDLSNSTPRPLRELQIRRRPLAADVSEDGLTLALLTSPKRINVYRFTPSNLHRGQSFQLASPAKAIAMAPDCSVIAAALENGISIMSLVARGSPLRSRMVASQQMDKIVFSRDGMMLLGTELSKKHFTTVAVHASPRPLPDEAGDMDQSLDQVWITQPFFPNTFQQCTHAVPLPNTEFGDADKAFAYDVPAETFGLLDLNALRFTSGFADEIGPHATAIRRWGYPTVNEPGDLVAVVDDRDKLLLFNLEKQTKMSNANGHGYDESTRTSDRNTAEKWISGRSIPLKEAWTAMHWVEQPNNHAQRLVGTLPPEQTSSLTPDVDIEEHKFDSGRICMFDFSCPLPSQRPTELSMEIATYQAEVLDDAAWGLDLDVNLAKATEDLRSPQSAVETPAAPLGRSVTRAKREAQQQAEPSGAELPRPGQSTQTDGVNQNDESLTLEEAHYSFDEPFSPTSPRSASALQRAATAASRAYRGQQLIRATQPEPILRHLSTHRQELPDESDADNWVPPPPPYDRSKELAKNDEKVHSFGDGDAIREPAAVPASDLPTSQSEPSQNTGIEDARRPVTPTAVVQRSVETDAESQTFNPRENAEQIHSIQSQPPPPPQPPPHALPRDAHPTRHESIPHQDPGTDPDLYTDDSLITRSVNNATRDETEALSEMLNGPLELPNNSIRPGQQIRPLQNSDITPHQLPAIPTHESIHNEGQNQSLLPSVSAPQGFVFFPQEEVQPPRPELRPSQVVVHDRTPDREQPPAWKDKEPVVQHVLLPPEPHSDNPTPAEEQAQPFPTFPIRPPLLSAPPSGSSLTPAPLFQTQPADQRQPQASPLNNSTPVQQDAYLSPQLRSNQAPSHPQSQRFASQDSSQLQSPLLTPPVGSTSSQISPPPPSSPSPPSSRHIDDTASALSRSSISPPRTTESNVPTPRDSRNAVNRRSTPPSLVSNQSFPPPNSTSNRNSIAHFPTQMFSKPSRPFSALTLHVQKSSSATNFVEHSTNQPNSDFPSSRQSFLPTPSDISLPSAAQLASLNKRRHTLLDEVQQSTQERTTPRGAAGARRSLIIPPHAFEEETRRDPIGSSRANALYGMPIASSSVDVLTRDPRHPAPPLNEQHQPWHPSGMRYSSAPENPEGLGTGSPPGPSQQYQHYGPSAPAFPRTQEDASPARKAAKRWNNLVSRSKKLDFADGRSYRSWGKSQTDLVSGGASATAQQSAPVAAPTTTTTKTKGRKARRRSEADGDRGREGRCKMM